MNSSLPLKRLTQDEIQSLNLLFLARFAPEEGAPPPSTNTKGGVFPIYHHELYNILKSLGVKVTSCNDFNEFIKISKEYNYIFTVFNRAPMRNPEVFISSMCEFFEIPYLGAPPNLRALAEDKYLTKALANSFEIPTLPGWTFRNLDEIQCPKNFTGPYFIKPRFGAASEEISEESIQDTWDGAQLQVAEMIKKGKECLIEQYLPGTDVTVPVLGGKSPIILPCAEEISPSRHGVATQKDKRFQKVNQGRQRKILEDKFLVKKINEYVSRLWNHLMPFDYLRFDFRLSNNRKELFLMEINIACCLWSRSSIPQSAKHINISHADVINHIISHSLRRQSKSIKVI